MNIIQNKPLLPKVQASTLKVKLFIQNSVEDIEVKINEWIYKNDIKICQVTQSQSEKMGRFIFVFTILYQSKN